MSSPSYDPYERLADRLPRDEAGRPLVDVAFYVTLYFADGYHAEPRAAAYQLFEEYWRLTHSHLRWTTNVATHRWEPVTPDYAPATWLAQQPPAPWVWQATVHGGETADVTSPYQYEGLGSGKAERGLSYVTAAFPATFFATERPDVDPVALVRRWAATLRPLHGSAGLAVVTPLSRARHKAVAREAAALALRLPGLEVNDPVSHSLYLQGGIKSVNWLTVLGDALLDRLGGVARLRAALPRDLILYEYPGGAVLQAGPHPEAGDRHRGMAPETYRAAARLLAPVQAHYPTNILGLGEERTYDWLHRFD